MSELPSSPSSPILGVAHIPNQIHRAVSKRVLHYNVLVVGRAGVGKTSVIKALFGSEVTADYQEGTEAAISENIIDLHERSVAVRLGLYESTRFGAGLDTSNSVQPIRDFLIDRLRLHTACQRAVDRVLDGPDSRIHALLYAIPAHQRGLSRLDILALKALAGLTVILPVLTKADTCTPDELAQAKSCLAADLARLGLSLYDPNLPELSACAMLQELHAPISAAFPLSAHAALDEVVLPDTRRGKGRTYKWGVLDQENEHVSDFVKLRALLIRTHLAYILAVNDRLSKTWVEKSWHQGPGYKLGIEKGSQKAERPVLAESTVEIVSAETEQVAV